MTAALPGAAGSGAAVDLALCQAITADRSETAFRELYRRQTPRLFQLAMRLLAGVQGDAEDAVQETWLRAVDRLSSFRGQSALSTWLGGILVNVCRERWREFPGTAALDGEGLVAAGADPGGRVDLECAVASLPTGARQVLVLHDIAGHTHEEVAALLGIDSGTSKSQLHRARQLLRHQLAGRPRRQENARA